MILEQHNKIAFDFDDTLINGVGAAAIQEYILANPHKMYWIVTFRTPREAVTIADELARFSDLTMDMFERIYPCPERTVMDWKLVQQERKAAGLSSPELTYVESLFPEELKFVHWKAYVCSRIGASVLVDDMKRLVYPGCERYKIAYAHPNELSMVTA
jgi:hypothetical protein